MSTTAITNIENQQQLDNAVSQFTSLFNCKPTIAASAPGRVNLIGEHTDYNDGFVMPMAIGQRTLIVAAPRQDSKVTVRSTSQDKQASFDLSAPITLGEPFWSNYVRGPIAFCIEKGLDIPGFDALIDTTVPVGAGLSSSASVEVAVATLAERLAGQDIAPVEKALLCQRAEHEFAGVPCGIMDQFICTMARAGAALLLDCRSHETKTVPLDDPNLAVVVINSHVKHELNDGEYAARRNQCEKAAKILSVPALRDATVDMLGAADMDELTRKRAKHVITENIRTQEAARAAEAGDWQQFGQLMIESHYSLRDDFEVSCLELDILVELVLQDKEKVYGSRMTGGGFGGCTVTLANADAAKNIARRAIGEYKNTTGISASYFITRPGAGAHHTNL